MPIHQNPDKNSHDRPPGNRSAIFPLHPFRLICASPPGGGKRQLCLDIIGRHPRAFDTITIIHLAPKSTEEYKILGDNVTMLGENELPEPDSWDRDKRNLLIIDEINVSDKRPQWKKQFDRLFNYASTHHSLSIMYQVQNAFDAPVGVRRACNHWAIWRNPDTLVLNTIGRRLGIKDLHEVFDEVGFGPHDSLWIDLSGHGPPLRKNITQIIAEEK